MTPAPMLQKVTGALPVAERRLGSKPENKHGTGVHGTGVHGTGLHRTDAWVHGTGADDIREINEAVHVAAAFPCCARQSPVLCQAP